MAGKYPGFDSSRTSPIVVAVNQAMQVYESGKQIPEEGASDAT